MQKKKHLSTNQVLELFCATMVEKEEYNFSRKKLMGVIHDFKQDNRFDDLLSNIKYVSNYSRDLERSIMIFKVYGIIFNKGVDSIDKLSISTGLNYNQVLEKFSIYSLLMKDLVEKYLECEKVYIKNT